MPAGARHLLAELGIQRFFQVIFFKTRLQKCFRHSSQGKIYDRATIFMQLVIHVLLGFRELRDAAHYHDDPLVQRVLGLKQLPDVATISRMLQEGDQQSVDKLRQLLTDMVWERIQSLGLPRVTLDFDGSVQSTKRRAEGTAVGFNKEFPLNFKTLPPRHYVPRWNPNSSMWRRGQKR